jgi:heat shock protein HtpX
MTSQIKTVLLLGLLTAIILLLGQAMGGQVGLIIGFGIALVMNVGSYWFSDSVVLSMYRAKELSEADAPGLHAMVGQLADNAGIPKPRLYLVPQDAPNAFATGRNPSHGVVAVTRGILQLLSQDELRGVLAHELGHIKNRDILIQTTAAVLGGAIMVVANMMQWAAIFGGLGGSDDDEGSNPLAAIALAIIAPIAAMLIQMAISRSREYLADSTGADISGSPESLAGALEKLDAYSRRLPMQASPATENMFIVNPFTGRNMARWFSTHPPITDRVSRLRNMSRSGTGRAAGNVRQTAGSQG